MGLSKLTDDELERIAYGRFRWEADIIARVGPAGRVAIDPGCVKTQKIETRRE
jgi:hypothetical protein